MLNFCTYFDRNYVVRAITLYRSLQAVHPDFRLWALCFDDDAFDILTRLDRPDLIPIRQSNFEAGDDALLRAKAERGKVDYYFTCSPSLPLYVLRTNPDLDEVTYLDADLYFFSDPQTLFDEMGDASTLIVPHGHPPNNAALYRKYGLYNVAYLTWRNDVDGIACLQWWRERCLEWCYNRVEDGKYADQRYLDEWPERFQGVHVLKHPGANVAPWNWRNYTFSDRGGQEYVDDVPLVFYHFHSLTHLFPWLYEPFSNSQAYGVMPSDVRGLLYPRYVAELHRSAAWLRKTGAAPGIKGVSVSQGVYARREIARRMKLGWLMTDPTGLFDCNP